MRNHAIAGMLLCALLAARGHAQDGEARELTRDEKRWLADCVKALEQDSSVIRRGAARALRCFGPEMLPELVDLSSRLRSDRGWEALADALAAMDRASLRARLEELREDWPRSRTGHWEGVLNRLRPPGGSAANPAVALKVREQLRAFQDTNTYSPGNPQVQAVIALGREAVPELIAILDGRTGPPLKAANGGPFGMGADGPSFLKEAAAEALSRLVTEEDRDALAALVAQGNYEAAGPLGRIPGEETLDALLVPIERGHFDMRLAGALAGFAESPRLRRAVIAYLDEYGRAGDHEAAQAAEWLGDHGVDDAAPVLTRTLGYGGDDSFRVALAGALTKLGERRGIEVLLEVFEKPSDRFGTFARVRAGERLNEICGKRLFLARFDEARGEHIGNWQEAATAFRDWWSKAKGAIRWDAEARRWTAPPPTPD